MKSITIRICMIALMVVGCFSSIGCFRDRYNCPPRVQYTYPAATGGCCTSTVAPTTVVPSGYYNPQPQLQKTNTTGQSQPSGWTTAKPVQ